MTELVIPRPSDWHGHARNGDLLKKVFEPSFGNCHWVLLMPNIGEDGLRSFEEVLLYGAEVCTAAIHAGMKHIPNLWLTIKIGPWTTVEHIQDTAIATPYSSGKLYPDGVTTHSSGGVRDFRALDPVYEAMQELGVPLNVHGEMPGVGELDAEKAFLDTLGQLATDFPRLQIVLEHVSTAAAVELVQDLGNNVAATITPHHMYLTYNEALLSGHDFCKPVAKTPADREALIDAAFSGDRKFFLGTDSAPHEPASKQLGSAAFKPGVYSGPVAIPLVLEFFTADGYQDGIERFVQFACYNGCDFYGVDRPADDNTITMVQEPWVVPEEINGIVPFLAGQELVWQVRS